MTKSLMDDGVTVICHISGCSNQVERYRWQELGSFVCSSCAQKGLSDVSTITGLPIKLRGGGDLHRASSQLEILRHNRAPKKKFQPKVDIITDE